MTKDDAVAFLKELRADAITLSDETSSDRVRRVFIGRAAMFADCANLLASAIIPTTELREAVKTVCCMADEAAIARPIASSFAGRFATVALVRAAFKEPDHA